MSEEFRESAKYSRQAPGTIQVSACQERLEGIRTVLTKYLK